MWPRSSGRRVLLYMGRTSPGSFWLPTTRRLLFLPSVALAGALGCTGQVGDGAKAGVAGAGGGVTGAAGSGLASGTAGSGSGGALGTGGTSGGGTPCTTLAAIPRRLWRLSVEQWGAAVKD